MLITLPGGIKKYAFFVLLKDQIQSKCVCFFVFFNWKIIVPLYCMQFTVTLRSAIGLYLYV